MERARSQILIAARELVAEGGTQAVTMAALARRAVVAKATVYNHFRDRDEVLVALLATERERLIAFCVEAPEEERLEMAAAWLSESAVMAGLRQHDADTLLRLAARAVIDDSVRENVRPWCGSGVEPGYALRWLLSFAVIPDVSGQTTSVYPDAPSGDRLL